ncbi:MFS transporter [Tabrizicola sp.]|jgi:predicted MFS family arabinose efflux permease|uniref:MFS transporter n=1 Tax=Tabrizicola sp. TaxID=2005166 RepID=UPI001A62816A|nr:MFS transporter [Tabrizicola sp.]MBL9061095.1 MFS transporter [Tabrizicola sp.]
MRIGIAALILAYVLSQFYRAFLAVMAPVLKADLGVSAADLASASGWWFLAFAAMQVPIGSLLDRIGPRLTTGALMAVGAVGALVFAKAAGALQLKLAMALIGIGCAPVLMASYFIFARQFSPAVFGTLAGLTIGIGSLGNVASALPLSAAVAAFGWRETMLGLAAITGAVALVILVLVRDPPRLATARDGSLLDLLRIPAIWPILAMMVVCYMPIAGLRGLWVGPYFADVHGADPLEIGRIGLWIGLAMVAGNFAYGPMDRWLGTRKWVVFGGNAVTLACLVGLWWFAAAPPATATALLIAAGFFGASFPMVIAHGRAFFPPHLMGRGVTLLNLFGIAPIGIAQIVTGRIHAATDPVPPAAPFQAVFLFFAVTTAIGLAVYLLSQDRTD